MNNSNVYQHVRTMCAGHTTYAQALSEDFAKIFIVSEIYILCCPKA